MYPAPQIHSDRIQCKIFPNALDTLFLSLVAYVLRLSGYKERT